MGPIERLTSELWPGTPVIPVMGTGATDGLFFRQAGIPVYGVSGLFTDIDDNREHGRDERLGVKEFYDGQEFLYRLVKELSAGASSSAATAPRAEAGSARVVTHVAPDYPPIALQARSKGDVSVDVKIDREGNVTSAVVTSGHPLLHAATRKAALRWKFDPAPDAPEVRDARLTFTFRLMNGNKRSDAPNPVFTPPYRLEIFGVLVPLGY